MALASALSSAVSGLKSQQTALDVIANNIANVNTTGYKAQSVSFSDLLSQTIKGASGSTATTGGTNPSQIGLGTQVSSINTDMTVGSISSSSSSLDVALNGEGYLVTQTTSEGDHQYTRAGTLKVDKDGNLNINGYKVCGWEAYTLDSEGNKVYTTTGEIEPINVYSDSYAGNKKVMAAKKTTEADLSGYLSSSASVVTGATMKNIGSSAISDWDATTTVDVIDEQGNKTEVALNLKKCATENSTTSWYWEASANDTTISPSSGYIAFDSDGKMVTSFTPLTSSITSTTNTTSYTDSSMTVTSGLTAGDYEVTVAGTGSPYTITLVDPSGSTYTTTSTDGSATFKTSSGTVTLGAPSSVAAGTVTYNVAQGTTLTFDSTPTINVASTTNATNAVPVKLDLSAITSTGTSTSKLTVDEDGYEAGTLTGSYTIGTDGTISASYSNGKTQSIGQIALAVFENANGLEKVGSNFYKTTENSGDYNYVVAGNDGSGTMTSYALELSNVDLASQFSSMMISQRAYQANSKIISTQDDMLQSLINMVG